MNKYKVNGEGWVGENARLRVVAALGKVEFNTEEDLEQWAKEQGAPMNTIYNATEQRFTDQQLELEKDGSFPWA